MSSRFLSKSMTEDVFKAPRTKRSLSKSELSENCYSSPQKRPRTRDDFFAFCNIVLQYTQYEALRQEEMRAHHNTSPLDSVGSTAESYTSDSTSSSFSTGSNGEHSLHHPESLGVEDDSWDLITCHCLKPYAGRPMIECSECETWIHLSCAKIRKSNIPDTFVCQLCRDSKLTMRKSSRSRTETKRVSV